MMLKTLIRRKDIKAQLLEKEKLFVKDNPFNKKLRFEAVFVSGWRSHWTWIVNIIRAVTTVEGDVQSLQGTLTEVQEALDDLTSRVEAIEQQLNPEPPEGGE